MAHLDYKRQRDDLLEALERVLPEPYGEHGGPLVYMQAFYEDGSESNYRITPQKAKMRISSDDVEKARKIIDKVKESDES